MEDTIKQIYLTLKRMNDKLEQMQNEQELLTNKIKERDEELGRDEASNS